MGSSYLPAGPSQRSINLALRRIGAVRLDSHVRAPSRPVRPPRSSSLAGCGTTVPGREARHDADAGRRSSGRLPKPPAAAVGNAAAGKAVFVVAGCGACHTFTPAGHDGHVGPNLDNLADLCARPRTRARSRSSRPASIVDPRRRTSPPGYPTNVMPPTYRHVADAGSSSPTSSRSWSRAPERSRPTFPRDVEVVATDLDRTLIWDDYVLRPRTLAAMRAGARGRAAA